MMTKKQITTYVLALMVTMVLSPAFANPPQTPEDCQRIYAGDDVKVRACIDSLRKQVLFIYFPPALNYQGEASSDQVLHLV